MLSPVSSPMIGLYSAPPRSVTVGRSAWQMTVNASRIGTSAAGVMKRRYHASTPVVIGKCRLFRRRDGRHCQYAGAVEEDFEPLQKRLYRLQRALDRTRADAAVLALALLARESIVDQ